MQRSAKYALIACVAVVVLGGAGFWWFVLRGTAPPEAALRDRSEQTTTTEASGDGPEAVEDADEPTTTTTEAPRTDPAGTWAVETDGGEEVFVGYRIEELFAGETVKVEAAGRTGEVDGTLVIDGTTITEVTITVAMDALTSDSGRRDDVLRTEAIETDTFPTATFVLGDPVELEAVPGFDEVVTLSLAGDLTLRDVTQPVTLEVEARWNGDTIDVAGGADILLGDFDIEVIATPFVTIDDNGRFEFQLTFVPT
ncbi:MAG: YceI family protein [Acidimicrobiia bacterium]|nr:YceI family protein [Acidimicrobiia bacterium]